MLPMSLLEFERQFLSILRKKQSEPVEKGLFREVTMGESVAVAQQHEQQTTVPNFDVVLKTAFPVVHAVVGDAFFSWLAKSFVAEFSSKKLDLARQGVFFADYLQTLPQLTACPYLPDVARLDWAWHTAYYGADDEPFDFDSLGCMPAQLQADIVFHMPRCATFVESQHPIYRIWEVNQPDYQDEKKVDLTADEGQRQMVLLDREPKEVMRLFAAALPFAEICEKLASVEGMPSAAAILPYYIEKKWLASFSLPNEVKCG